MPEQSTLEATPGPWETNEIQGGREWCEANGVQPRVRTNAEFHPHPQICVVDVAEVDREELDEAVRPGRKPKKPRTLGRNVDDWETAWANANLIAAAPDLYEFAEFEEDRESADESSETSLAFSKKWFGRYPHFKPQNLRRSDTTYEACNRLSHFLRDRSLAKARGEKP